MCLRRAPAGAALDRAAHRAMVEVFQPIPKRCGKYVLTEFLPSNGCPQKSSCHCINYSTVWNSNLR
jgi:hypothetical protein